MTVMERPVWDDPWGVIFDVDDTLVDINGRPRYEVIDLLRNLARFGVMIGVWSGGGADYARHNVERLGLDLIVEWVGAKGDDLPFKVLFTVDDGPEVDFGVPNLQV